jgi:hypothetical protein
MPGLTAQDCLIARPGLTPTRSVACRAGQPAQTARHGLAGRPGRTVMRNLARRVATGLMKWLAPTRRVRSGLFALGTRPGRTIWPARHRTTPCPPRPPGPAEMLVLAASLTRNGRIGRVLASIPLTPRIALAVRLDLPLSPAADA